MFNCFTRRKTTPIVTWGLLSTSAIPHSQLTVEGDEFVLSLLHGKYNEWLKKCYCDDPDNFPLQLFNSKIKMEIAIGRARPRMVHNELLILHFFAPEKIIMEKIIEGKLNEILMEANDYYSVSRAPHDQELYCRKPSR